MGVFWECLLAPYLTYFGFYDIFYNNYEKLDEMGYSEIQKSAIKWMINNILILFYFLNDYHFRWLISDRILLKWGSLGVALTSVWIPCLKNYPTIVVLLMLIHAFCVVIGPLHTVRMFFKRDWRIQGLVFCCLHINFFNFIGKSVLFHLLKKPVLIAEDDDNIFIKFAKSMAHLWNAQNSLEFVRCESCIALFSFIFTVLIESAANYVRQEGMRNEITVPL